MVWPPPPRALEGTIVRMEPLGPEHLDDLRAASENPETWVWMDRRIPVETGAFDRWFDTRTEAARGGAEWPFATVSVATGQAIGSSSYLSVRPEHAGLEIGWTWLNPSAWRSGANREAKLLMIDFAIDELGCMRVEFKTDARNQRSRAALEGLGATFEGVFRNHMLMPVTGVRDSAYFSITDSEWPAVRSAIEARLRTTTDERRTTPA